MDCWAHPQSVWIWDGAPGLAIPAHSQVLLLLVRGPHFENCYSSLEMGPQGCILGLVEITKLDLKEA